MAAKDLCRSIAAEIVKRMPADLVAFAFPLAEGKEFRIRGAYPESATSLNFQVSGSQSGCVRAGNSRSSQLLTFRGEREIWAEEKVLRPWSMREAAFIPLVHHEQVQAVVLVGSRQPGSLRSTLVHSMVQVSGFLAASLAAFGPDLIARPRSSETECPTNQPLPETEPSTKRLLQEEDQERLCRKLLEEIRANTPCRRILLTLLDAGMKSYQWFFTGFSDEEIDEFHRRPLTDKQRREVFEKDRTSRSGPSNDSRVYLPLVGFRSRPIGFLALEPVTGGELPSGSHLEFIRMMAALTAMALERNWMFAELKRERNRLQKIQEQLVHSERLSAVGQLVSGVAHELNNPLAGVVGFSELVQRNNTNPECAKNLDRVVNEAKRCRHIVGNLLNFVRRTKAERRPLDINEIVENVLDLRAYALKLDNVRVVTELAPDLPRSTGSFHQIQQVLLNIINNAHQAMQEIESERLLRLRTFAEDERVVIRVEDTGPGIAPSRLERVFEPFFTTKAQGQGTGLGLSVSQGIIKEHGGRIAVESIVDKGTSFTIELPIRREREAEVEKIEQVVPAKKGNTSHSILVVDDEQIIVELLNEVLISAGHRVETARDGKQALEKILTEGYDAVISDLKMPGMDGEGLYQAVCHEKPEMKTRFVFSTGDLANPSTQEFFRKTGCLYIMKPFDLKLVRDTLDRLFSNN